MRKIMLDQIVEPEPRPVISKPARYNEAGSTLSAVPPIIVDAGGNAVHTFQEFFAHIIHSENTRIAYSHAINRFFAWCHHRKLGRLADVQPALVRAYIKVLEKHVQKSTVKQHLAALRMLFDRLVADGVVEENPVREVRNPVIEKGKTTAILDIEQAYKLLDSIDTTDVVGLRDRALIGVMIFACARVGAIVTMQVHDYYPNHNGWWIRLHEKGGKQNEIQAHDILKAHLDAYIIAAGLRKSSKASLFRSAAGSRGTLTENAMNRIDAWRMIQRRAARFGLKAPIGCHTFRATGIMAYLGSGATLDSAKAMAAHVSPRTTKLYDRSASQ